MTDRKSVRDIDKAQREKELRNEKEDEKARLIALENSLRAEVYILEEMLEQAKDRILVRNGELNTRKRKLKALKWDQERIIDTDKSNISNNSENQDNFRAVEKEIKQKLTKLISSRQEVDADPNELFYYDGQKADLKPNLMTHTVKVKLIQPPPKDSKNLHQKIVPKEATFRINKEMTFSRLKMVACDHWVPPK